jgi:hypothetical protein
MRFPIARGLAAASGLAVLCATTFVWPAEWAFDSQAYARLNYNDNVNLLPDQKDRQNSISLSPSATFSRNTERSSLSGNVQISVNRFPGNSALDSTDDVIGLNFHDQAERLRWGIALNHIRDSTLQTELAQTGIVQARKQRTSASLSPDVTWSWSERLSTTLSFLRANTGYEAGAGLADYSFQRPTLATKYLMSERTALIVQAFRSKTTTTDDAIEAKSTGATIGLTHDLSETLTLSASVGQQSTDTRIRSQQFFCPFGSLILCQFFGIPLQVQSVESNTTQKGLLFDLALKQAADTHSWSVGSGRDTQSTASGQTVETTRISADFSFSFDERRSAGMSGSWLRSKYIGGEGATTDYRRIDAFYSWRFAEYWTLGTGVGRAQQKAEGNFGQATANSAYASVTYVWPRIAVAR